MLTDLLRQCNNKLNKTDEVVVIFSWNEERIRLYLDASRYTNFHQKLSTYIIPYLQKQDKVFDFGCGLGQLDIVLSPYVKTIKGFDASDIAIEAFQKSVEENSLSNITSFCQETQAVQETCDVGIMSFFGMSWGEIERHFNLCQRSLITIFNWENDSTLYPVNYRRTRKLTGNSLLNLVEEQSVDFEKHVIDLEFGQPFHTYADAEGFIRDFAPAIPDAECTAFLEENLQSSSSEEFEYYLPNKKKIGIFVLKH